MPEQLQKDIFVFFNRHKNKVKILSWHNNGFVLLQKHLDKNKFTYATSEKNPMRISSQQLSWLLAGLDWITMSEWDELSFQNYY